MDIGGHDGESFGVMSVVLLLLLSLLDKMANGLAFCEKLLSSLNPSSPKHTSFEYFGKLNKVKQS
jgi:hypothetical protein